jgi:O-antigen/teichoic acid export membrane protein
MLAGNVSYGFSQWALLVALAKIGTIEMVGTLALALAIGVPVLMFMSLSLRSLQVTDHRNSYRFLEYSTLRILTVILSIIFIFAFGVTAGYSPATLASIALIVAAKAVEYLSDILYGLLQRQEHMAGIAISMILRGALSVGSLSLGVYLTRSLVWGAAGLLLSSTLVLLIYDIPKALAVAKFQFSVVSKECINYLNKLMTDGAHRRLWKLGMAGLPMGFVLMLVSLNLNIPRYFIQRHLGMRELAIFSAIATLMAAGSVVTNAVGQAAAPRLSKCFATRDMRGFGGLLAAVVAATLGLGALGLGGALLFGREAMAIIYRPEYSSRQDVLVWLMAASGFFYLGSTLRYAVTAVRCFTPQLPLFAVAAPTTAIGCMALIPTYGLRGAAMAIFISAIIQCGGSAWLLYRSCRQDAAPAPSC